MTKHLIAAALTGCMAFGAVAATSSTAMADPIYVEVRTAPRYEDAPTTYYEGRPVYYVDGHWYYRHGPRWVYYREEPRPLIEYRSRPEYRAPHHHHYDHHDRDRDRDRDRDHGHGHEHGHHHRH